MTPEEEIRRAGRAREILDNEMFKEAVAAIEEAIRNARLNSSAKDVEFREKLYAQELALTSVIRNLQTFMESGQLAEEEIRRRSMLDAAKELFN